MSHLMTLQAITATVMGNKVLRCLLRYMVDMIKCENNFFNCRSN
jgi:hypothetical protein